MWFVRLALYVVIVGTCSAVNATDGSRWDRKDTTNGLLYGTSVNYFLELLALEVGIIFDQKLLGRSIERFNGNFLWMVVFIVDYRTVCCFLLGATSPTGPIRLEIVDSSLQLPVSRPAQTSSLFFRRFFR